MYWGPVRPTRGRERGATVTGLQPARAHTALTFPPSRAQGVPRCGASAPEAAGGLFHDTDSAGFVCFSLLLEGGRNGYFVTIS